MFSLEIQAGRCPFGLHGRCQGQTLGSARTFDGDGAHGQVTPPCCLAGEQAVWAKGVAFLAAGLDARKNFNSV